MTTINHKTLANGNTHMFCPDGLLSARPSSPTNAYNPYYYATDTNQLFVYFDSTWVETSMYTTTGISFLKANSSPVSTIIKAVTATVPTGYLYCNGAAVSRTTYAALFAITSTAYGAGNGSTTFNLPDFRGRFLRGYDGSRSAAIGIAQADGLPNIVGAIRPISGTYNLYPGDSGASGSLYASDGAQNSFTGGTSAIRFATLNFAASLSNSIYGASSYVTPYNHAVYMYIKY